MPSMQVHEHSDLYLMKVDLTDAARRISSCSSIPQADSGIPQADSSIPQADSGIPQANPGIP